MSHRYALQISYDGTGLSGWQSQTNARTVQDVMERAVLETTGEAGRLVAASRTDAGVHARGQVAHLDRARPIALGALTEGLNHALPREIRVLAARETSDDFHARRSALGKRYVYRLIRARVLSPLDEPFAVRAPPELDPGIERLRAAARRFEGEHDFSAFALTGGSHTSPRRRMRRVDVVEESGGGLRFVVEGDGFLRGMVRGMVGTWLEVGTGRRSPEDLTALLVGEPRSRAGPTAPARGLCLDWVDYGRVLAFDGVP